VGVAPLCTALAVCVRLYDVVAGNGHLMARRDGAEASTAEVEGLRVAHLARALFTYTGPCRRARVTSCVQPTPWAALGW